MSEAEYAERAQRTRDELATELEPMEFYAQAYRRSFRASRLKASHDSARASLWKRERARGLAALDDAGLLAKFVTALGWSNASPLVRDCR